MNLNNLKPASGARRRSKRLGQGIGSGSGKTSSRGHKGQNSRSGGGVRPGFEGGQMPLMRRIPKRGFNNGRFRTYFQLVNLDSLASCFEAGDVVTVKELFEMKLIKKLDKPVKILARGEVSESLTVHAHAFSGQAVKKIEAAGGKAEVI